MLFIKNILKTIVGTIFKTLSVKFNLFENKNIIFMYHRVTNEYKDKLYDSAMYVTPESFEMHIKEIKKYFEIVPLGYINNTENKSLCSITFDDGWKDNYDFAFPILQKYGVPATVFLTVNTIDKNSSYWFHDIWEIAEQCAKSNRDKEFWSYFEKACDSQDKSVINEENINNLIVHLKQLASEKLTKIIIGAYQELDLNNIEKRTLLNWKEIEKMSKQNVSFGSHTLNHYILTGLTKKQKQNEIEESRNTLKNANLRFNPYFCYPNGNWDEQSVEIARDSGYRGAVTTNLGYNSNKSNNYLLNRIGVHDSISNKPSLLWYRLFQCYMKSEQTQ